MSTAVISRAKPVVISVIGLVVVFGLLYAWRTTRSGGAEHHAMPPMPVSTIRAEPRGVAEELQAVGNLQAVREVLLAPDTSGRVTAINFDAGQSVKEGTVLIQLYDAPEQADRAAAAARPISPSCNSGARRNWPLPAPSHVNCSNNARRRPPRPSRRCGNWTHVSSRKAFARRSPARSASGGSIPASTSMPAMRSPR